MIWVLVVVLILIVAILFISLYRCFSGRFIQVSGHGIVKQQPNEASVIIGLRTDNIPDTEIASALESNGSKFRKIIENVKKLVPNVDVETRTYAISPNNANVSDNMYTIYNSALVQIHGKEKLTLLPDIIRNAVQSGSNSISNIEYTLDDAELEKAKLASEEMALKNARINAQYFARLLRENIGSAEQIIDNPNVNRGRSFSVTSHNLENNILFVPRDIEIVTLINVKYKLE